VVDTLSSITSLQRGRRCPARSVSAGSIDVPNSRWAGKRLGEGTQ
jgi:hypothetical protein